MKQNKTLKSLRAKLHPARFTDMSSKMAAIVGCVVDETYTNPRIVHMIVTSDNFVLGQHFGDCGFNQFIGDIADLNENWFNLLQAAGLTNDERQLAESLFEQAVPQHG